MQSRLTFSLMNFSRFQEEGSFSKSNLHCLAPCCSEIHVVWHSKYRSGAFSSVLHVQYLSCRCRKGGLVGRNNSCQNFWLVHFRCILSCGWFEKNDCVLSEEQPVPGVFWFLFWAECWVKSPRQIKAEYSKLLPEVQNLHSHTTGKHQSKPPHFFRRDLSCIVLVLGLILPVHHHSLPIF